jgi:hypothetical protein
LFRGSGDAGGLAMVGVRDVAETDRIVDGKDDGQSCAVRQQAR